ncbi:hypothetical protein ENSA5_20410 [Enhygromyxa salina]|uniref:Peptidase M16 inactive domain protein n=1 Tax=Enhygromyxa salina TaxID=215803 RepID=A0A2S9YCM2_9BACT|nr:insulinase family protein [Enhygromyxa salina]PRQ02864.1 hypothetical protein ENSA5_20410 [Enhygromyxa salina]
MSLRILAYVLSPFLGVGLGPATGADSGGAELGEVAPVDAQLDAHPDAGEATGEASDTIDADPDEGSADDAGDDEDEDEAEGPAQVVDVVLPCGVRVITAKDASLPVAAVVLAVEVGTRDDPDKLPGLVHALAYQLQQGNRELAPGEAIATAHDVGGLAAMAVGAAQVRFESLVPISQLDAQLRVEALRLRAPNVGRELWLKSLSYARNDDRVKTLVPREAAAIAWQDEGMKHDGRVVGQGLADMLDQAVGAQLARLYDYRVATLVVVGPDEPQALLERVEPLFADLSARPRKLIAAATTPKAPAAAPRVAKLPRQKGDSMVWAVPGNPAARAWAQVLCGTLNRQQRVEPEPPRARVRCTYADDPRRPMLVLRAIGFDPALGPEPLIAGRLARVAAVGLTPDVEPDLAALVEAQRARIETDIGFDLRTPLELASYLASASERRTPATAGLALRARDELLGLPLLPADELTDGLSEGVGEESGDELNDALGDPPGAEPGDATAEGPEDAGAQPGDDSSGAPPDASSGRAAASLAAAIPGLLDTRRAVLLLDPEQDAPPPLHPPAATEPTTEPTTPANPESQPASAPQPADAPAPSGGEK